MVAIRPVQKANTQPSAPAASGKSRPTRPARPRLVLGNILRLQGIGSSGMYWMLSMMCAERVSGVVCRNAVSLGLLELAGTWPSNTTAANAAQPITQAHSGSADQRRTSSLVFIHVPPCDCSLPELAELAAPSAHLAARTLGPYHPVWPRAFPRSKPIPIRRTPHRIRSNHRANSGPYMHGPLDHPTRPAVYSGARPPVPPVPFQRRETATGTMAGHWPTRLQIVGSREICTICTICDL